MSPVAEAHDTGRAGGEARLDGVGVRFDFDRLGRVVTPGLALFRRIRSTTWGLRGVDLDVEPGSGLALIGAVVAEFVAGTGGTGSGLAYEILQSGFQLDIPRMFAALALLAVAGIVINAVLGALGAWVMRRR